MDIAMDIMKRALAVVAAIVIILLSSAGTGAAEEEPYHDYITPGSIARYILLNACGRDPARMERVDQTQDAETVAYYLTEVYGLEPDSWTDCAIYRAGGMEALEIAVIRAGDEDGAEAIAEALEEYLPVREGDFAGYEPAQADIVHDSAAAYSVYGDAALLICEDADWAEECFRASYRELERLPFDPPHEDDMTEYDTAAILEAWRGGDRTGLTEKDAAILDMAADVLAQVTEEGMTDLERERAVYEWITANTVYDMDHYDPLAKMDPDSFNPYGMLKNGKGVCLAFATTFQLLMDMADVECITVVGSSSSNTSDHAWNMVCLDGVWYCADPTWDVESPPEEWDYFNVPSDLMARTNHQWDYENVPEADFYGPQA